MRSVSVSVSDNGSVVATVSGVEVGESGSAESSATVPVTFVATPDASYYVTVWTGACAGLGTTGESDAPGTSQSCVVSAGSGDIAAGATFVEAAPCGSRNRIQTDATTCGACIDDHETTNPADANNGEAACNPVSTSGCPNNASEQGGFCVCDANFADPNVATPTAENPVTECRDVVACDAAAGYESADNGTACVCPTGTTEITGPQSDGSGTVSRCVASDGDDAKCDAAGWTVEFTAGANNNCDFGATGGIRIIRYNLGTQFTWTLCAIGRNNEAGSVVGCAFAFTDNPSATSNDFPANDNNPATTVDIVFQCPDNSGVDPNDPGLCVCDSGYTGDLEDPITRGSLTPEQREAANLICVSDSPTCPDAATTNGVCVTSADLAQADACEAAGWTVSSDGAECVFNTGATASDGPHFYNPFSENTENRCGFSSVAGDADHLCSELIHPDHGYPTAADGARFNGQPRFRYACDTRTSNARPTSDYSTCECSPGHIGSWMQQNGCVSTTRVVNITRPDAADGRIVLTVNGAEVTDLGAVASDATLVFGAVPANASLYVESWSGDCAAPGATGETLAGGATTECRIEPGTTEVTVGATFEDVVNCESDRNRVNTNATECGGCVAGHATANADDADDGAVSCLPVVSHCPAGEELSGNGTACAACGSNEYNPTPDGRCVVCGDNGTRVSATVCECDSGYAKGASGECVVASPRAEMVGVVAASLVAAPEGNYFVREWVGVTCANDGDATGDADNPGAVKVCELSSPTSAAATVGVVYSYSRVATLGTVPADGTGGTVYATVAAAVPEELSDGGRVSSREFVFVVAVPAAGWRVASWGDGGGVCKDAPTSQDENDTGAKVCVIRPGEDDLNVGVIFESVSSSDPGL